MNYRTMVKGALALSLSLTVASAMAATTSYSDLQAYGATFENAVNLNVGELNDYAYTNNMPITDATLHDAAAGKGWFAGAEEDESKIIDQGGTNQVLQLNTDAATLTNKFASGVAGTLNTAIGNAGTAFFETDVKFVASDTLDAGITGGQDATKFAIYAYVNENVEPNTTNLVVYHAYVDGQGNVGYTNEPFATPINTEVYTKLRVEMKQLDAGSDGMMNVFSVSVNGGEPLSSDTAFDAYINNAQSGTWFLTVNEQTDDDNKLVSSLNFKGTGEIDNINVGTIVSTTEYAIDFVDEDGTTPLFATNVVAGTTPEFLAETPTKAETVASNFVFAGWSPALYAADKDQTYTATYTATVRSYEIVWVVDGVYTTNTVAYGVVPAYDGTPSKEGYTFTGWDTEPDAVSGPATYTAQFEEEQSGSDDYAAGDTVDGAEISAGMAAWLNTLKGEKTKEAFEEDFDSDGLSLYEEYLLNTDPTEDTTVAFTISSIAVGSTVDLNVALTRTENNAAVETPINGVLKIYGAASLDGTFAADQTVDEDFDDTTTASKSFSTQNKFFKAVIEEAAQD